MIGTLGLLVDDGIEQFVVYGAFLVGMVYIDKIGCLLGDAFVGFDVGDNLIIVIQRFGADIMASYLHGPNPYIHHQEQDSANEHRTPSSSEKLRQVGCQKDGFDGAVCAHKQYRQDSRHALAVQVETEQKGGHQHGDGDGESVGCLHVRGVAKEQDDENHADVHGKVDHRDIELSLYMGRMLDSHTQPEVQVHGFAQYREGAADKCLTCHDCRTRGHDDGEDQHALRLYGKERIHGQGSWHMVQHPSALSQIVENEHGLYKCPTDGDVFSATMSQVGVESLGTGSTEKHGAKD